MNNNTFIMNCNKCYVTRDWFFPLCVWNVICCNSCFPINEFNNYIEIKDHLKTKHGITQITNIKCKRFMKIVEIKYEET